MRKSVVNGRMNAVVLTPISMCLCVSVCARISEIPWCQLSPVAQLGLIDGRHQRLEAIGADGAI